MSCAFFTQWLSSIKFVHEHWLLKIRQTALSVALPIHTHSLQVQGFYLLFAIFFLHLLYHILIDLSCPPMVFRFFGRRYLYHNFHQRGSFYNIYTSFSAPSLLGGFVLSTVHNIGKDRPQANLRINTHTFRKQKKYCD